MNVQELIDTLQKVEDKTKIVKLGNITNEPIFHKRILPHYIINSIDDSIIYSSSVYLDVIDVYLQD